MKRKIFYLFATLFFISPCLGYIDTTYWFGTLQFSQLLEMLPSVRIYKEGETITLHYDHNNKQIIYSFSANQYQKIFHVIVVKQIYDTKAENGSTQYLRIDTKQPYAFYKLEYKDNQWHSKQLAIPYDTGRIPDSTLIFCINPNWVEKPLGGTEYELPTFYVNNSTAGSEDNFHKECHEVLFSCCDSDRLHRNSALLVKCDKNMITTLEQQS